MTNLPQTMHAVLLTGYGGFDKLEYRDDVAMPILKSDEVLIRVSAAGINNTDINTRVGWYNSEITEGTTTAGASEGFEVEEANQGDWGIDFSFPRIQGADIVGRIVAAGESVDQSRIGARVVCDPYVIDPADSTGIDSAGFLGAVYDGGFAQYCAVPTRNVYTVPESLSLSDEQIATLPCSGGTAMNMLLLAGVKAGDIMLVTGASGGVGTFLIQLGKHLGAKVIAVASQSKHAALLALGADAVVDRADPDLPTAAIAAAGGHQFTVVADVVGGENFPDFLAILRRGGRYVTAGAIAGPIVELDLRTLYLKSLSFFGSTVYRPDCFQTLVDIASSGGLNPQVDSVRPLQEIQSAQQDFLKKTHIGSLVLTPP